MYKRLLVIRNRANKITSEETKILTPSFQSTKSPLPFLTIMRGSSGGVGSAVGVTVDTSRLLIAVTKMMSRGGLGMQVLGLVLGVDSGVALIIVKVAGKNV